MSAITVRSRRETVARWVLGIILLWAGWNKLADPTAFFVTLLTYELPLPDWQLRCVAVALPWLEILMGVFLLADFWAQTIRLMSACLFGIFLIALFQSLIRGLSIECGCFGTPLWEWMGTPEFAFVRAAFLFGLSCWLTWRTIGRTGGASHSGGVERAMCSDAETNDVFL